MFRQGAGDADNAGTIAPVKLIKIGGSLEKSDRLADWLKRFDRKAADHWIIVPGGGRFADHVRVAQQHWRLDDRAAHAMALLAMAQMAWLIEAHLPKACLFSDWRCLDEQTARYHIWQPEPGILLKQPELIASWRLTSDSLAAWLARKTAVSELVLLKMAELAHPMTPDQLGAAGIVDDCFAEFCRQADFTVRIEHPGHWP